VNRSEESAAALEATIQELAAAIRETDVYRAWQEARAALAQRHAAQVMLRDLQAQQEALLRKAQAGEAITPEDEERLQRTLETVSYNPYVRAVLETDLALAQLLAAVQQALAAQLGMEAGPAEPSPGAAAGPRAGGPAGQVLGPSPPPEPPRKSRLWVPGQP